MLGQLPRSAGVAQLFRVDLAQSADAAGLPGDALCTGSPVSDDHHTRQAGRRIIGRPKRHPNAF
jgi:hypothetical protein